MRPVAFLMGHEGNPSPFRKVAAVPHLAKRPVPATGRPVVVPQGFRDEAPKKEGNSMVPRYARPEMTAIWSAENRFRIWFEIEAHATDALAELGTVPKSAAKALWDWWATNPRIDASDNWAITAASVPPIPSPSIVSTCSPGCAFFAASSSYCSWAAL